MHNQPETGTGTITVVLPIPQWGVVDNHHDAKVTHIRSNVYEDYIAKVVYNTQKYAQSQTENTCTHNPVLNSTRVARQTRRSTPPTRPSSLSSQRVLFLRSHSTMQNSSLPRLSYSTRPARGDRHKARDFHFQPQLCEIRVGRSPATRHLVGMA